MYTAWACLCYEFTVLSFHLLTLQKERISRNQIKATYVRRNFNAQHLLFHVYSNLHVFVIACSSPA